MSQPPLTPEQIEYLLRRGEQAAQLLANEVFVDVLKDLAYGHLEGLLACKPGETDRETRDYHHLMHAALQDIEGELKTRIATAEEIKVRFEISDMEAVAEQGNDEPDDHPE